MTEVLEKTCVICGGRYDGLGHNPEPFGAGTDRCCEDCNDFYVTPVRIVFGRFAANHRLLKELVALARSGRFILDSRKMISAAKHKEHA